MSSGKSKIALAILTYRPHEVVIDFYSRIDREHYDLFVFVDDNEFKAPDHKNIRFIQIEDAECAQHGYYNFNPTIKKKWHCSAWDKAIYYFSRIDRGYQRVWFIEEDAAIVSASNTLNETGEIRSWYWWRYAPIQEFDLPWAWSMVCAVRIGRPVLDHLAKILADDPRRLHRYSPSRLVLRKVLKYLRLYKYFEGRRRFVTYPFIELVFHTIAANLGLKVAVAEELKEVHYRMDFDLSAMSDKYIYHPVKDPELQRRIREAFAASSGPAGAGGHGGTA
jgi:hypothetical protein